MMKARERGVALAFAMIMVLVLSVLAVSLMFVSQAETWSSMNYRLMTQARYGAEAGLNKAINHLVHNYTPPGGVTDPLGNYNTTVSPVLANGAPVILSSNSSVTSNYPVSSAQDAFRTASQGYLNAGPTGVSYNSYATLLSMRQIAVYGSNTPATIQTWLVTADGNITGIRDAQVEVSAILERQPIPVYAYAVFATYPGCDALGFSGGGTTDSFDSGNIERLDGSVVTQAYGGNVGSNGNLQGSGRPTTINGSLSTPRNGVGNCTTTTTTALTDSGNMQVTGGMVELPQAIDYPLPSPPNPMPPTSTLNLTVNSPCGGIPNCVKVGDRMTLGPGSYGNLNLTGQADVHFTAGTYTINSITLTGNATLTIDSGPVILQVAGQNIGANQAVIDFTGGTFANPSMNPADLQIQYAGSGLIKLAGSSAAAGLVYAPGARINFTGGADWYGAVIGQFVDDSGGTAIHYDRSLQTGFFTVSNYMMSSFTWKKY